MAKLLIVDDEPRIRDLIAKYAQYEGYETVQAQDGVDAVQLCRKNDYDLIIMDVMMPQLNGFAATKEIRRTKQTPIIMLSARGEEYDRIHGFELGVDDYVQKPFSPKELMMRIDAVLRRLSPKVESMKDVFHIEGLCINCSSRIVTVDGKKVPLSPKEFELLLYMVRHRGIALTRDRLLDQVWGFDYFGDNRTLDTHIKLVRKHIEPYSKYIVTLRGVGYRFEE
ncbi:MAG: response regulator transcription factor [Clostridia bacterium]|nr:response regulator transcription factor [Clostridia bacterium]